MTRSSWLLLVVLGLACAGQPAWVLRPDQHRYGVRYVVAVGTATLTQGAARARIVAEQSARAALAARVRTQVQASVIDSLNERLDHATGQAQSVETLRQSVSSNVNQLLEGVEILEVYADSDAEVLYALAALDVQALRERTQLWQADTEQKVADARRQLRSALARMDLMAVEAAVQQWQSLDLSLPVYVQTLQAFDASVVGVDVSVSQEIGSAMAELQSQWPAQNLRMGADGELQVRVPAWSGANWKYRLSPAGGVIRDLSVQGGLATLTLAQDVFTDDRGQVFLEIWPQALGKLLAHTFVVQLPYTRPAALHLTVQDRACGESARASVQAAMAKCLTESGWRVVAGEAALAVTYTLSCEASQSHDFGTGTLVSAVATLQGGAEADGRAPVLDYRAVVVGTTDAQLRTSISERMARAACAEIH